MTENRLLKFGFLAIIIACLMTLILSIFSVVSYRVFFSIVLAALFATISFIIAVIFIKLSEKKPSQEVLGTIFKGMAVRLLVLVLLVIISLKFLDINQNSFIFSILIFYIYYLTLEIILLNIRNS